MTGEDQITEQTKKTFSEKRKNLRCDREGEDSMRKGKTKNRDMGWGIYDQSDLERQTIRSSTTTTTTKSDEIPPTTTLTIDLK